MHDGENGVCLARSPKVVEGLLLHSERETKWMSNRRTAGVAHAAARHTGVGNKELTLRIIVLVITHAAREQE